METSSSQPSKRFSPRIAIPAGAITVLIVLAIVGSIASLGRELSAMHWTLGAAFYILIAACAVAGIIYPIARTLAYPSLGLHCLYEGNARSKRRTEALVRERIARHRASDSFGATGSASADDLDGLAAAFQKAVSPAIDRSIKKAAKEAFLSTAISQTPAFDALSVLAVNMRLVRSLVRDCGFRPSAPALMSLYVRTMKSAIVAGGIEELDYGEMFALIGGNAALSVPGAVLGSAAQGAANAFLTVRMGVIAKGMLLSRRPDASELRRSSYGEALRFLKDCGFADDVKDALMRQAANAAEDIAEKAAELRKDVAKRAAGFGTDMAERASDFKDAVAERISSSADAIADAANEAAASTKRALRPVRHEPNARSYTTAEPRAPKR